MVIKIVLPSLVASLFHTDAGMNFSDSRWIMLKNDFRAFSIWFIDECIITLLGHILCVPFPLNPRAVAPQLYCHNQIQVVGLELSFLIYFF